MALRRQGLVSSVIQAALGAGGGIASVVPGGVSGPQALAISGAPATFASQGVAYSDTSISARGGTGPYTFTVQTGSLPAGLSLNSSTGAITGTPTTVQTLSGIVIRVTDAVLATADLAAFAIAVRTPATISGTPYNVGVQNIAYTGFSVTGSGGSGGFAYSIAAGSLPAGITLNSSTGAVSGTPTAVQTQVGIVIRATDSEGRTADLASFTITVLDPAHVGQLDLSSAANSGFNYWIGV